MYFFMQGTPFIYQGQEIGMTNVQFDSIEDYNDVATKNLYQTEREERENHMKKSWKMIWKNSRDNARTPMQWNSEHHAGFTTGVPWIKVNPNYVDINVEKAIQDPDSIYHFYKKLIGLRKEHETLVYGSYELILAKHDSVYAYTRTLREQDTFIVITNLFGEKTKCKLPKEFRGKKAELILSNYDVKGGRLKEIEAPTI